MRAFYAPVGPLPQIVTGTPSRSTSLRIPSDAIKSRTPDADKKKPVTESRSASPLQSTGWQEIKSETFEGLFPNTGWTLIDGSNDGYEYLWDDDDYRPRSGYWAGWPANGGANGLDPQYSAYPPNMSSWMIYGPFDLSNARTADTVFWLWRQIEVYYDYVFFGISSDGTNFSGWTWDGTVGWEEQRFSLNGYLGDSSVWVAWLFVSDSSVQYEGPWVDDILIRKYVPGQVTVRGSFYYFDRNDNYVPARFTKVYLYDWDADGNHDPIGNPVVTDSNGFFQFPPVTNWDEDDSDPDPNSRRLDLYVVWETDYNDSATTRRRVTNFGDWAYKWVSETRTNISDGTAEFHNFIPNNSDWETAMWIFQDTRRAWEYVRSNSSPQTDPGSVTARWERDRNDLSPCTNSCFYAGPGGPYVFIAHHHRNSVDTIVHEVGHHYMHNATGWWLWWDIGCYDHDLFTQESVNCAWSEGWSDFFAVAGNGDPCYDLGIGPCTGTADRDYYNLETHTRNDNPQQFPWGDTVEGRVAGALYDLMDPNNEAPWWDSANFGFAPIWNIVRAAPHETTFLEFWNSWRASGNNRHHAVRAIYQNTIDYNTAPRFNPLLPDRSASEPCLESSD